MSFGQLIPTFNAGELSPYLDARSDIEKYASGCRLLENFVIMPYGGVYRRPGTEYLGAAKYANKRCRLVPFNFSISTRFVLEFGERYIRFWSNGVQVEHREADDWVTEQPYGPGDWVSQAGVIYYCLAEHTSGDFAGDLAVERWVARTIVEVETPYLEGELRAIQYLQIDDVMYLAHPNHAPQKLLRLADDDWTMAEVAWDWPAVLDENVSGVTLTPSATTGQGISLTVGAPAWAISTLYRKGDFVSSGGSVYKALANHTSGGTIFGDDQALRRWEIHPVFEAGHVGSDWQLAHARDGASVSLNINGDTVSGGISVVGSWDLTTYETWTATVQVQRRMAGSQSWETIRSYIGKADRNVIASGKETRACELRLRVTGYGSGSGGPHARLEVSDVKDYGVVRITEVAEDGMSATADVVNDLFDDTATTEWSEGAWSVKQGFPRTLALHEQRIYYAGTARHPQSIWGSVIDDFENFRISANDDAGLFFTLSAQEANPVQWMTSQDRLLIGTAGEEWTLGSSDPNSTITPSNVQAIRQSSYGSKAMRGMVVNEVILFVQRQGRKVRELVYSFEKDGWVAPDLTVLAEHVTRGEILESAFQQQPDAIYWTVTGAGQLVGMTYERDQNVVGWHRHTTQGVFESVASIYGANGADELWVAVKRTVKGRPVRYIERFKVDFREAFEQEDRSRWWYLDCAKRGVGTSHPTKSLPVFAAGAGWTALPANRATSVTFTNTTGVEIILLVNGEETVVPVWQTVTIGDLKNTADVQYKASAYGALIFDNVEFHYGTAAEITGELSVRVMVPTTPVGGYVTLNGVTLDTGWTLNRLRLDVAQNKVDQLNFQRDGQCGWGYNYPGTIAFAHTEGQFPEAGLQTLSVVPDGFVGSYPLYYDEVDTYDLTYADDSGSNTVRTSSGAVRYEAATAPMFEFALNESYVMPEFDHLEGEEVGVFADGAVAPNRKVTNGQVGLPASSQQVLAGLPYVSRLQPMKSEMSLPDGTTRSRKKRVNRVAVSLCKSLGGEVSTNGTDWSWIYSRSFGDPMDSAPPLLNGDHEVIVAGGNGRSVDVTIRQAQPLPLTVLGAVVKYDTHGD
ncbi:hypothetical protein BH09VER1_BH09VER1_46270 [soil metagenome]